MTDVFVTPPESTRGFGRNRGGAAPAPAAGAGAPKGVSPPPVGSGNQPQPKQQAPPAGSSPQATSVSPKRFPTNIVQTISSAGSLYHPARTLEFATDLDRLKEGDLSLDEAELKWSAILYYEPTQAKALEALKTAQQVSDTFVEISKLEKDIMAKRVPTTKALILGLKTLVAPSNFGGAPAPAALSNVSSLEASLKGLQAKAEALQDAVDKLYEVFKDGVYFQELSEIEKELEFLNITFMRDVLVSKPVKIYDRPLTANEKAAQLKKWNYIITLPNGNKLELKREGQSFRDVDGLKTYRVDFVLPDISPFKPSNNNAQEGRFGVNVAARIDLSVLDIGKLRAPDDAETEDLTTSDASTSSKKRDVIYIKLLTNRMTGPDASPEQRSAFRGLAAILLRSLILYLRSVAPKIFVQGGDTPIGLEAMNERPTSAAGIEPSDTKEYRDLIKTSNRDQARLEAYYESLGFVKDNAYFSGENPTAVGMSTTVENLLAHLPEL